MLPELHAFMVLFHAESVGVVTSGHVTKMAVTPFDPQWSKTHCYTQTPRLSFVELELLPIEVDCENREFPVFFAKNNGKYEIFHSYCKIDAGDAEHIF